MRLRVGLWAVTLLGMIAGACGDDARRKGPSNVSDKLNACAGDERYSDELPEALVDCVEDKCSLDVPCAEFHACLGECVR